MAFTEKDLENIIMETPFDDLDNRGLYIPGKKFNQVKLGNYGIADIISAEKPQYEPCEGAFTSFFSFNVIELKLNEISVNTFMQAVRYKRGLQRLLYHKCFYDRFDIHARSYKNVSQNEIDNPIRLTLIGNSIDFSDDFIYLADTYDVNIYTYEYKFDGIHFEKHDDVFLKNEGF